MAPRREGRFAVYLVTVSPEFKPERYWDFPEEFFEPELVARNLPFYAAAGYTFVFNKRAKVDGLVDHRWAIVAHGKVPSVASANREASQSIGMNLPRPADFRIVEFPDGSRSAYAAAVADSRAAHYLKQGKVVEKIAAADSTGAQSGQEVRA